jgi:imidazole glycerol phosphate synthase subunit HisF
MEVLQLSSERIFVPLCIGMLARTPAILPATVDMHPRRAVIAGGGIRDYTDSEGVEYSALDVASSYFRSGADKVSLGSDAVLIAEEYWNSGGLKTGKTPIERISFM